MHEAEIGNEERLTVWGTGSPRRDFLHVNDLADTCVFLMDRYSGSEPVNVGSGEETTIKELALIIKDVVGFKGKIRFDAGKPDGVIRKLLDIGRLNALGWQAKVELEQGLSDTYRWYKQK